MRRATVSVHGSPMSRSRAATAAWSYSTRRCSTASSRCSERVGGAGVAVERHAHRAGVDQLDARAPRTRGGTAGGCGRTPARGGARRRAARPRRRPARGRTSARRSAVSAWQISASRSSASCSMSAMPRPARRRAPRGRDAIADRTTGLSGASSTSRVQRSPLPRTQIAFSSPRSRSTVSTRPAAEQRVVAAEDPAARALRLGVRQHGLQRRQVPVDVVQAGEHPIACIPSRHARDHRPHPHPALRDRRRRAAAARAGVAIRRSRSGSRGGRTRASTSREAYIAGLEAKRENGELLDFLVVHAQHGPIGVTGLSELSARNRHATVGTWFGREYWGSGANRESKALIAALAFRELGMDRLTAWANTRNGRSQIALERAGFRREGVLRDWHRHGDTLHDVVVFGMTRRAWEHRPWPQSTLQIDGAAAGRVLGRVTHRKIAFRCWGCKDVQAGNLGVRRTDRVTGGRSHRCFAVSTRSAARTRPRPRLRQRLLLSQPPRPARSGCRRRLPRRRRPSRERDVRQAALRAAVPRQPQARRERPAPAQGRPTLQKAATRHARDMVRHNYFAHQRPAAPT